VPRIKGFSLCGWVAFLFFGRMDWSVFHWLTGFTRGVDGGQDAAEIFNTWGVLAERLRSE